MKHSFDRGKSRPFRVDRFMSVYFFRPILRLFSNSYNKAAILMYHSISDRDRDFRPFYQTNTAPETFRQQMQFLHDNKYPVVSLEKLAGDIISGRAIEPGTVVLTFDDGEVNFYTAAFPVLREFGFPATVFLTTGAIDNADKSIAAKYLTWDQVRETQEAKYFLWLTHGQSFGA